MLNKPSEMDGKKIKVMEDDISSLIDYAFDHGIQKSRIRELALLSYREYLNIERKNKRKFGLIVLMLLSSILFIAGYFLINTNLGFALLRLSLIQLLPFWDWTTLYRNNCLLKNPFYDKSAELQRPQDCSPCQGLYIIPKQSNVTAKDVLHKHMGANVPILLSNSTFDWPARKYFNIQFLKELFLEDEVLSDVPPCLLQSNLVDVDVHKPFNLHTLLSQATQKNFDSKPYYVHWENCDKKAIQVLRKFYKRPRFLHSSVEIAPVNWLVVSSNQDSTNFIMADLGTSVSWFVQIKGSNKIKLQPSSCNKTCPTLYGVLQEGDTVLWTQPYWQFSYKPLTSAADHSISMLFGGFLD